MAAEPVPGHGRDEDPPAAPREPAGGTGADGIAARAAGGYAAFEQGCSLDGEIASAMMAVVLDDLAGPARQPAGASDDAVVGMLGGFGKLAAWCESGMLGLIRELIRRNPQSGPADSGPNGDSSRTGALGPGGLPGAWARGLAQQISAELAISARAADKLLDTAYALARLPETAHALDTGVISGYKAAIIAEATSPLTDTQAAEADRRAAPRLAGKTPGQVREIIRRTVIAVDPEGARRRREQAQREHARVEFWQDAVNGTASLAGFALPTDEGLMCHQAIQDRALAYKKARLFPGMPMDLLRVRAYIDLLLSRDARDTMRSPAGHAACGHGTADGTGPADAAGQADEQGQDSQQSRDSEQGQDSQDGGQGHDSSGDSRAPEGGSGGGTATGPGLAANVNLTLPLATLLGLAERPGHLAGLGAIDPALARDLAAAAAASNRSTWCVTVTNDQGHAIGHGCAHPTRRADSQHRGTTTNPRTSGNPRTSSQTRTPATSGTGTTRTRDGPTFTQRDEHGPPGGYGSWALTLGTGKQLTVSLGPIPLTSCDHRYESAGWQPSRLLRHLVQIRDGTCDFPPCRRPAAQCDFEHATPYHRGGRTDLCNCKPRCRCDHQVKQSQGWSVTQILPGWHEWRTPSGRRYASGPTEHPI